MVCLYKIYKNLFTLLKSVIQKTPANLKPKTQHLEPNTGFTLIEVLVSIGLFAIIVAIAIGGLARALRAQRQVASLLAASSNVSLVLEQMAREIRTGSNFGCDKDNRGNPKCRLSSELVFTNATGDTVTYCLNNEAVERGIGDGVTCGDPIFFQKITGDNVLVRYLDFRLLGHGNRGVIPDDSQPRITISLGVSPKEPTVEENILSLQTTISSRLIDE